MVRMIKVCHISKIKCMYSFFFSLMEITLRMECNARTNSLKEKSCKEQLKHFKEWFFLNVKTKC